MGQGSGEVSWVRLRNSEATAILRLSTIRLDQGDILLEFSPNIRLTEVFWAKTGE